MGFPRRGKADYYAPGEHNVACFQCGGKFKSSQMFKHWQGYLVCRDHWEPRHPQDFVKAVREDVVIPNAQPQTDTFLHVCTALTCMAYADLGTADCMQVGNTPGQEVINGFGGETGLPPTEPQPEPQPEPQLLFFDTFTGSGPLTSHTPDVTTIPTGVYDIDGADFNTNIVGGKLSYSNPGEPPDGDYGTVSYGQTGEIFSERPNFVLSATINFGAFSGLSYQALYIMVRRNSGIYGILILGSDVTLYGVDDGTYTTGLTIPDNTDVSFIMTFGATDVRFQFGATDFTRSRQAPQVPASNDYIKGLYVLLSSGPCTVDDLRVIEIVP